MSAKVFCNISSSIWQLILDTIFKDDVGTGGNRKVALQKIAVNTME